MLAHLPELHSQAGLCEQGVCMHRAQGALLAIKNGPHDFSSLLHPSQALHLIGLIGQADKSGRMPWPQLPLSPLMLLQWPALLLACISPHQYRLRLGLHATLVI